MCLLFWSRLCQTSERKICQIMYLVIYQYFSFSDNISVFFSLLIFIISISLYFSDCICVWSLSLLVGGFWFFVSFYFPLLWKCFQANLLSWPGMPISYCSLSIYCCNTKKAFVPDVNTVSFGPDSLKCISPGFSPIMYMVLSSFPEASCCILYSIIHIFSSFNFQTKHCTNKRLNWRAPGTL